MNAISSNITSTNSSINEIVIKPELYKFVRIIFNVQNQMAEKKVVTWLKSIDEEIEIKLQDEPKVRRFIFPILRLEPLASPKKFEKKQTIALLYAKILTQYVPEENGYIDAPCNYIDLVCVIQRVFLSHINKNKDLFTIGLQVHLNDQIFCAKVETESVFIFSNDAPSIGRGGHGHVYAIWEFASHRHLAYKDAKTTDKAINGIIKEISNLKLLHSFSKDMSADGLQPLPLMTINTPPFIGYVGKIYEERDLACWNKEPHENPKRIAMCQSLMRAFKSKTERNFWHGDIKEENILIEDEKCVIIDWAGAITFQESWEKLAVITYFALHNMNPNDLRLFQELVNKIKRTGDRSQYEKYTELANGMDLFSVAMVMFRILTSENPFEESIDIPWPLTSSGINPCAMQKLVERKYGKEIEQIIIKMLSHDFNDRYSVQKAIDIWENLCI